MLSLLLKKSSGSGKLEQAGNSGQNRYINKCTYVLEEGESEGETMGKAKVLVLQNLPGHSKDCAFTLRKV